MTFLDQIGWREDHFVLGGNRFVFQVDYGEVTEADGFVFYKNRAQVEQLDRFLTETGFSPQRILELGIWDGGSCAFWTEGLEGVEAFAAIGIQDRGDSTYFERWKKSCTRTRVTTHWGVSQTDGSVLDQIIREQGLAPLDLVIDHCSHQYAQTLRSFEILFGRLRPGGYYVIEDWAWALQPAFQEKGHPWGIHGPLHPLAHRVIDIAGALPEVISSVKVYPHFIAIERGAQGIEALDVPGAIARRPRPWPQIALNEVRAVLRRVRRGNIGSGSR